jgi:hypothetical protein
VLGPRDGVQAPRRVLGVDLGAQLDDERHHAELLLDRQLGRAIVDHVDALHPGNTRAQRAEVAQEFPELGRRGVDAEACLARGHQSHHFLSL